MRARGWFFLSAPMVLGAFACSDGTHRLPDQRVTLDQKLFTEGSALPDVSLRDGPRGDSKKTTEKGVVDRSTKDQPFGKWVKIASGTTKDLEGVWGSSNADVFISGNDGTILHYDGSKVSAMSSSTTETLHGIWGTAANNVFAVGYNGTVVRYNGTAWSKLSSGTTDSLRSVWGSGPSDVFAVGAATVVRYNGAGWTSMSPGVTSWLSGVWGLSGTDVLAIAANGEATHFNGSSWSPVNTNTFANLNGVWGTGGSYYVVGYKVGSGAALLKVTGSTVQDIAGGLAAGRLYGVSGSGSMVYAVGEGTVIQHDGSTWSEVGPPAFTDTLYGVWAAGAKEVFAVGAGGALWRGQL